MANEIDLEGKMQKKTVFKSDLCKVYQTTDSNKQSQIGTLKSSKNSVKSSKSFQRTI